MFIRIIAIAYYKNIISWFRLNAKADAEKSAAGRAVDQLCEEVAADLTASVAAQVKSNIHNRTRIYVINIHTFVVVVVNYTCNKCFHGIKSQ